MNPWFGYPPMDQYLEWLRQNQQGTQAKPAPAPVQSDPPQPKCNIQWVQGSNASDAYVAAHPLNKGDTLALWDSDAFVIYLHRVDENGKPQTQILDYTIRKPKPAPEYATKESVDELSAKLDTILAAMTPKEENANG